MARGYVEGTDVHVGGRRYPLLKVKKGSVSDYLPGVGVSARRLNLMEVEVDLVEDSLGKRIQGTNAKKSLSRAAVTKIYGPATKRLRV